MTRLEERLSSFFCDAAAAGLLEHWAGERNIRDNTYNTSAKFLGLWTPSPPVHIWVCYTVQKPHNLPYFVRMATTPHPPPDADVI